MKVSGNPTLLCRSFIIVIIFILVVGPELRSRWSNIVGLEPQNAVFVSARDAGDDLILIIDYFDVRFLLLHRALRDDFLPAVVVVGVGVMGIVVVVFCGGCSVMLVAVGD
ncbi:hypothetical protein FF2_027880 [Malus domestica]